MENMTALTLTINDGKKGPKWNLIQVVPLSQREYKHGKDMVYRNPIDEFHVKQQDMSQWSLRARDDQRQVVFFSPCRNYKAPFPKRVFL